MKKLLLIAALGLFTITAASAQNYKWAGGMRLGGDMGGLTLKHKFNASDAIEGIFAFPWKKGFVVTAMYERHVPVIGEGFNFYYGGGAHLGSWDQKFATGVNGVVGLEYKLPATPLAFSADYKPTLNLVRSTHFYMVDFALGIKLTF